MERKNSISPHDAVTSAHEDNRQINQWSREVLGLPNTVDRNADKCLVLEYLEHNEFVPSPAADAAIRILWGSDDHRHYSTGVMEVYADRQRNLDQTVQDFAQKFFRLTTSERQRQWDVLNATCDGFPLLKQRLARLQLGLAAESGSKHPELMAPGHLGHWVQRLFVASRSERRRILKLFRREFANDRRGMVLAASLLKRHHTKLAVLEPKLLEEITTREKRLQKQSKNRAKRARALDAARAPSEAIIDRKDRIFWVLFFACGLILSVLIVSLDTKSKKSSWHRGRQTFSPPVISAEELEISRMMMRENIRSDIEALEILCQEQPENPRYQHRLAKRLLKSTKTKVEFRARGIVVGPRSDAEQEAFYRRASRLLHILIVEYPDEKSYGRTFIEASLKYRAYAEAKTSGSGPTNTVLPTTDEDMQWPELDNWPSTLYRSFSDMADTHLQLNHSEDALATLLAKKQLAAGDPEALFHIALHLGSILVSYLNNIETVTAESIHMSTNYAGAMTSALSAALEAWFTKNITMQDAIEFVSLHNHHGILTILPYLSEITKKRAR